MDEKLIVVVPGFASRGKDECLKRLIEGLSQFAALRGSKMQAADPPAAPNQYDYFYEGDENEKRLIAFREAFWSDLAQPLSDKSPFAKFSGGIAIILYWVLSPRVLKVVWSNRYMFTGSVASVLILLIWYYGAVAAALTAIGSSEGVNPFVNALPQSVSKALSDLGSKLAGWQVWLSASALMALLPVNLVIDVAHSTRRYFANDDDMARKLRTRIAVTLNEAKWKNYSSIIVFAHSFGAIAAVDALTAFRSKVPIYLITAGSPLSITCARSPELEQAVQRLLKNPAVIGWSDFYSYDDWMCCAPPIKGSFTHFKAHQLKFPMGFFQKFTKKAHISYFNNDILLHTILEI